MTPLKLKSGSGRLTPLTIPMLSMTPGSIYPAASGASSFSTLMTWQVLATLQIVEPVASYIQLNAISLFTQQANVTSESIRKPTAHLFRSLSKL